MSDVAFKYARAFGSASAGLHANAATLDSAYGLLEKFYSVHPHPEIKRVMEELGMGVIDSAKTMDQIQAIIGKDEADEIFKSNFVTTSHDRGNNE